MPAQLALTRKGRAMKYMGNYYWTRTDHELNILRSKKFNRLAKLNREVKTYLNIQETQELKEQVSWIDAVLRARSEQTELGL